MKTKGSARKKLIIVLSAIFFLGFAALLLGGAYLYAGPFRNLNIARIERAYRNRTQGVIVYGASNFALWSSLEYDMYPWPVQNHEFGGSTDNDLMRHAHRLLYPFEPAIIVFQSGSNDFLTMTADEVILNKDRMFTMFREHLPDTTFVVLSMLPLPGREDLAEDSADKRISPSILRKP